jgi:hypothetical protein
MTMQDKLNIYSYYRELNKLNKRIMYTGIKERNTAPLEYADCICQTTIDRIMSANHGL